MKKYLFILFLLILRLGLAQEPTKSVHANEIKTAFEIDAQLNEDVYLSAQAATNFYQIEPFNGEPAYQKSEVYFFYDQQAVYIGAMLYDETPDSIFNYLTERDEIGMSDCFGVYLDPYNKGQLSYGFFVNVANVQTDLKAIKSNHDYEDGSWNAVWESKTRVTDEGWVVEMRIPFSALRFPKENIQAWGLNMFRNIRRYNSNNSWSHIDDEINGWIHQQGELTGIKNIKPPVRLSFSPFVAAYEQIDEESTRSDFFVKGGMDIKYGINESFTLDMMLVPDFGQVQSDDKKLNLSPYEIYYDEKRQFFNEGTELFNRAGIFYSRRIGDKPHFSDNADKVLTINEIIDYRPTETQLINATKVSGRTKNGLGVGVLNAMSLESEARLKDTLTGETRTVQIQPFTNYNVTVVDKSLPNNSYVSFINTNVSMQNNDFLANVTASELQLSDKKKRFTLKAKAGLSVSGDSAQDKGASGALDLEKNSGKFHFSLGQDAFTDKFNVNDLGYLKRNNSAKTRARAFYFINDPFFIFRNWNLNIYSHVNYHYKPFDMAERYVEIASFSRFKNNHTFFVEGDFQSNHRDYYKPRADTLYVNIPYRYSAMFTYGTDRRKRINAYSAQGGYKKPRSGEYGYWWDSGVTIRIGQRFNFEYDFYLEKEIGDVDYYETDDEANKIYFSQRDVLQLANTIEMAYSISESMSLRFRGRHYYSGIENYQSFLLLTDGNLAVSRYETENKNYINFNVDMSFRWIFSPGSEFVLAWKNNINNEQDCRLKSLHENYHQTFINSSQVNNVSLKILYYLDYNHLKFGQRLG